MKKQKVNKYEILYGGNPDGTFTKDSLQCTRIIYAVDQEHVIDYYENMWPNIEVHNIKLVEKDIDISEHTTRRLT